MTTVISDQENKKFGELSQSISVIWQHVRLHSKSAPWFYELSEEELTLATAQALELHEILASIQHDAGR